MYNLKISVATLIILVTVLILHIVGMSEDLYTKIWFYDIILHILGGVGIALTIYCIGSFLNIEWIKTKIWSVILVTFLAGLAWEYFEVFFDLTGSKVWSIAYYLDTVKDLFNDTLGAIVVTLILRDK